MAPPNKPVSQILKAFAHLPRFPDGRIDYSRSDRAPVITCFVKVNEKLLLLKRSERVRTYRGKWNTVAGYLDEPKSVRGKALEELQEELGITRANVARVRLGEPFEFFDPEAKKSWLVNPVLVELKNEPDIHLDWEHTEYRWVSPNELADYDTVPKLDESLKRVTC